MKEIYTRRSIRKYTNQKVEKEKLIKLLDAAMNAPTAVNRQEWRFVVVEEPSLLREIAEKMPNAHMVSGASAALIVCGDCTVATAPEYIYVDCGAAIQNILLMATKELLGACWCAIGPSQDRIVSIKSLLNLPEEFLPVACVAIGYPNEEKEENNRYDEEKVTWM